MANLKADIHGHVEGYFTIPALIPAGCKLVQAYGSMDTYTETTFTGRGRVLVRELLYHRTPGNYDPLAQTFQVNETVQCCGVDLKFAAQGTTDALVQIREVVNGMPTTNIRVQTSLPYTSLSTDEGTWTRFLWPAVTLMAGVEYAVSIACNDATMSIRHAELGKYDVPNQKWMAEQPYTIGVMQSSSNGTTWTPDQFKDFTFRLLQPTFTDTNYTRSITLTPVDIVAADYLLVMAGVIRPFTSTNVVFELTVPTTPTPTVYTITENQALLLPQTVTGQVTWRMILTGAAHESPWLLHTVQLVSGATESTGTYVSRAFPINSDGSTIVVTLTAALPSPSTLAVYVQDNYADGSEEPTWSSALSANGTPKPVAGTWYERSYIHSSLSGVTHTRLKIVLAGSAQTRPQVTNLQCIVKDA